MHIFFLFEVSEEACVKKVFTHKLHFNINKGCVEYNLKIVFVNS